MFGTSGSHSNADLCKHEILTWQPSSFATSAGCKAYSTEQALTAATGKKARTLDDGTLYEQYPAPLCLPGDQLCSDMKESPQSLRSWLNLGTRNKVTSRRKVIYIAAPPSIGRDVHFMRAWSRHCFVAKRPEPAPPDTDDVINYLQAFYCGQLVRRLPIDLKFMRWRDQHKGKTKGHQDEECVGLATDTELVRIGVRRTRSEDSDDPVTRANVYTHQLNLNDLLDVAISVLPADAFALLMIVHHDIYEGDEDEFSCGGAYGGSRIAIVSTARYHPSLDDLQEVDRAHGWPASHCASYVDEICNLHASDIFLGSKRRARPTRSGQIHVSAILDPNDSLLNSTSTKGKVCRPLQEAVRAHTRHHLACQSPMSSPELISLHLFRICRTASHELGHCFGLDHCVYKACVMQGTASLAEDNRQPPYLCPVCEAKMGRAMTQGTGNVTEWKLMRHLALREYSAQHGFGFAALSAWTQVILEDLDGEIAK